MFSIMGSYVNVCFKSLVSSGVVVPGEVGILLIYTPIFFFYGPEKDERPVS